jgi:hypothetical protein
MGLNVDSGALFAEKVIKFIDFNLYLIYENN